MRRLVAVIIVLGCLIGAMIFAISQYRTPVLEGTWVDKSTGYYVVFNDDGTYVESIYNVPRQYSVSDGTVTMYNAAGQKVTATLTKSYKGRFSIDLNGEVRNLERTQRKPVLFNWESVVSGTPTVAYDLMLGLNRDFWLGLYNDNFFVEEYGNSEVFGKYATTSSGELVLIYSADEDPHFLKKWDRGYVFGLMDSNLFSKTQKTNLLEDRGLVLQGTAYDVETDTLYQFMIDNTVTRRDSDGSVIGLNYFVDTSGLVTLTDALGMLEDDYLYFDTLSGSMYRYVLELDGWVDYLNTAGGTGGDSSEIQK